MYAMKCRQYCLIGLEFVQHKLGISLVGLLKHPYKCRVTNLKVVLTYLTLFCFYLSSLMATVNFSVHLDTNVRSCSNKNIS